MVSRANSRRQVTSRRARTAGPSSCQVEPLETRTLFSSWSTVAMGSTYYGAASAMTADGSGNVYAVGYTTASNGSTTGMLWEKPAGGSWGAVATVPGRFVGCGGVSVNANGDVFITGQGGTNNNYLTTWELPKGASSVIPIDTDTNGTGAGKGVTLDGSGNLYVVGYDSLKIKGNDHRHWLVRKGTFASGKWSFASVDEPQYKLINTTANGIAVTPAGVYVAGYYDYYWTVRFSPTGASGTWTTVDSFTVDTTGSAASQALAIGSDGAGHLYVGGTGQVAVKTGSKTYTYQNTWLVRKSGDTPTAPWGPADDSRNWSPSDPAASYAGVYPVAIGHDTLGNLYVAGGSLIRKLSAGGGWSNSDISNNPSGNTYYNYALTGDFLGNMYASGEGTDSTGNVDDYFIRSLPAAPTNLTATPDSVQPSSQIDLSWSNAAGSDATGFAVYRSTDGVSFTLLGTVDASVTNYADGGLAAGTTYSYYVKTLLNSDGVSDASAIASATTSA